MTVPELLLLLVERQEAGLDTDKVTMSIADARELRENLKPRRWWQRRSRVRQGYFGNVFNVDIWVEAGR